MKKENSRVERSGLVVILWTKNNLKILHIDGEIKYLNSHQYRRVNFQKRRCLKSKRTLLLKQRTQNQK